MSDYSVFIAALDFYVHAGIDLVLDHQPHNHFDGPVPEQAPFFPQLKKPKSEILKQSPIPPAKPASRPILHPASLSPDQAIVVAHELAQKSQNLDELKQRLSTFQGCSLQLSAKNLVFSDGVAGSRVMLIGEAPGADEDRTGVPFVGRSGQLLDRMLAAIGLDRTKVYIANVVPWRPPGNRTPTPQEAAICRPFLERQIELAQPDILVCLGNVPAQSLTNTKQGITTTRGKWVDVQIKGRRLKVLPTFHPSYLLRQPLQKRWVWQDLLSLKKALDGNLP